MSEYQLEDGKIFGEEFFKGRKMTKDEYLSLVHFDKREDTKNSTYRLCDESMIEFLESTGKRERTLLLTINYVNGKESNETIELIW